MPIKPEHQQEIDRARAAHVAQLEKRIEAGAVNIGELAPIMQQLDFLKALEEVLDAQ